MKRFGLCIAVALTLLAAACSSGGSGTGANGPNGQVIVPIDSIADVWTKQFSTSKTIGVALAVVAVVGVFFVVANKTSGSASGTGY